MYVVTALMPSLISAQDEVLTVYFDVGKNRLSASEIAKVKKAVSSWEEMVIEKIEIEGYCDDTGNETLNYTLSLQRAHALSEVLESEGIDAKILSKYAGHGSLQIENLETDISKQRSLNRKASAQIWYHPKTEIVVNSITASIGQKPIDVKVNLKPLIMGTNIATGDRFTLEKVLFVGSRDIILASSYGYLTQFTDELKARPDVKIKIEGHVCCTKPGKDGKDEGSGKKNLSHTRAKAVFDYLVANGIDPSRMEYEGMKGEYPLGGDASLDRREEIIILDSKKK